MNATVVGVSRDTVEDLAAFGEKVGAGYPMASDIDKQAVTAYRVPLIRDAYPQRCLFIIDPHRKLRYVNYGYRIEEDYPDVLKTLEAIQAEGASQYHTPGVVRALEGLDPVELVEGRRLPGLEKYAASHRQYEYLFANPANRKRFEENPARYEIQLGGGCGRMGPLSGWGDPGRFEVHDGRIYIFASEACRKDFLSAPEDHLDRPDPVPPASPEALAKGMALLDRAVEAMGGANRIDGVKSYRARFTRKQEFQGKEIESSKEWALRFPGGTRRDTSFGDWRRAEVLSGDDGFIMDRDTIWAMHPSERFLFERTTGRELIVILKVRRRPDFRAAALGATRQGAQAVETVAVSFGGSTTTLGIDPKTFRVLSMAYRGRPGIGPNGEMHETFSDFRSVEGLSLPFRKQVFFDGKPVESLSFAWTSIEVNGEVDEGLFARPDGR